MNIADFIIKNRNFKDVPFVTVYKIIFELEKMGVIKEGVFDVAEFQR